MTMMNKFTERLINIFFYMSTALITGILADFLISKNIYLDMRIHAYQPVLLFLALGLIAGLFKKSFRISVFLIIEIATFILILFFGNFDSLIYIIRDILPYDIDADSLKVYVMAVLIIINAVNITAGIKLRKNMK